jgi:hypothetical protein
MKKFLALSSILLLTAISIYAQEHSPSNPRPSTPSTPTPPSNSTTATTATWVRLASDEGRFSVLLPELAKDQAETAQSDRGPYTTHLFVVKTTKGVFLVGWVDYDPSFNFTVQSELEANRDNFVKGVKATLLNTSRITLDGHPGLEFTAETPETVFRSRVYIVGRRPYQLIAGTYKGQNDSTSVSRFFDSFEVRR